MVTCHFLSHEKLPFFSAVSLFCFFVICIEHLLANTLPCVFTPLDAGKGIVVDEKPTIAAHYLCIV